MNKQVRILLRLKGVVTGKDIIAAARSVFSTKDKKKLVLEQLRVECGVVYYTAGKKSEVAQENLRLAFGDTGEEPGLDLNWHYAEVWVESWEYDQYGILDKCSVQELAQAAGDFAGDLYESLSAMIEARGTQKA